MLKLSHVTAGLSHLKSNPSLAVVVAEAFLSRLGFGVVTFALPFYARALGMSLGEVGVLIALRLIVAIVMKPLMGVAADRYGMKAVYVASLAGRCVIAALFIFATAPWALFLVRGLQGVASAAREPAAALLVVEHADERRVASTFAWYAAARSAGMAIGFPLAGLLLALTGDDYARVFLFTAATAAIAVLLVWRYASDVRTSPSSDERPAGHGAHLSANDWLRYAVMVLLMAIPANMIDSLFPLIVAARTGLDKASIGIIYTLSMLVVILAGPLLGWIADTFNRRLVLAVRSVSNITSSLLYLVLPGFWGMTAARMTDDVGKAAFKPAWGSVMGEIARSGDRETRGRRLAYLDTAESIGEAAGPILAGLLWQYGSIYWLFAVRVALSVLAEINAAWALSGSRRASAPRQSD